VAQAALKLRGLIAAALISAFWITTASALEGYSPVMHHATVSADRSVLVLVDYQQRLMPAIHRGEQVVAQALRLADVARELGIRVIGTEQNQAGLGPNV
jgi:isochorismate hydrolase